MEEIKWNIQLNEQQEKTRQENIAFCLHDAFVLNFLKENGLNESFVEEHSAKLKQWAENKAICAKCQGLDHCQFDHGKTFEIVIDDGFLTQVYSKCRYLKEEEEKSQYLKNYRLFHGNNDMKLRDFSMLDIKRSDSKELLEVSKLLMQSEHERKGIYLHGKPGIGKTFLMNCMANLYVKKGKTVAFVNSATLISDLKNGFGVSGMAETTLNVLKNCDVLFLDDIGGESISAWSRDEILMPLLNERMEKNKKTYFTSNYSFNELEEHFSIDSRGNVDRIKANRLMERIKAVSAEKNLKGVNRRL